MSKEEILALYNEEINNGKSLNEALYKVYDVAYWVGWNDGAAAGSYSDE